MDLEISFIEGIVRRDSSYVDALQILGDDYTRRGRHSDGLKIDETLSRLQPNDPLVHYNLACSYSLMEECGLAVEALTTALNLGYRDFKWMAQDPDLKFLRANSEYKVIRAKVRQLKIKAE